MKTAQWARFWLFFLIVLLLVGCERNHEVLPGSDGNFIPSVISFEPIQSIRGFRGSTVTYTITATVNDARGEGISGVLLAFNTASQDNNLVTAVYYDYGDTTDTNGRLRVNLVVAFTTLMNPIDTLNISCRLTNDSQIYAEMPVNVHALDDLIQSFNLNFAGAKSTIVYRQGERDSTQLVAQILGQNSVGMSGLPVDFHIVHSDTSSVLPFVILSVDSAVTDANGEARIWIWNNPDVILNRQVSDSIVGTIRGMQLNLPTRTAGIGIHVQPLSVTPDIYIRWVSPFDTSASNLGSRSFVVWMQDSSQFRIPNIPIHLRLVGIGSIHGDTTTGDAGIDTVTWSSDGMIGRATIFVTAIIGNDSVTDSVSFEVLASHETTPLRPFLSRTRQ